MMKPLTANTMIQDRYLVVHLIGKGGMGEVYLAVDQRLGSAVALKRTYFADDGTLGGAFEREARILARLRHPVLPKVSDHFSDNGDQYLVMEHIAGDDLSARLEAAGKPFPVSWVIFWADQLLDALSYLHSHEPPIIHRDIKPQNLKLTDENHIVLLDFGLSKESSGKTMASTPGTSGSVVGYTPHFASMEQIRGTGTDARSDIYSLCATLYQLMSNTIPPDALTRADALLGGSADPILPLSEANPEVSPAVSNVILKGLELSREKRFGSAQEMQRALRTAHAQMQGQMSAATQVFSTNDIDRTEPPVKDPTAPLPASEMATKLPTEHSEVSDLDATVQMSNFVQETPKQADVKTEAFSVPSFVPDISRGPEHAAPPSVASSDAPSSPPPLVSQVPQTPAFFTEAAVEVDKADIPVPVQTIETEQEPVKTATAAEPAATPTPTRAPAAKAVKKEKKGSKAGLILGGLAVLFLLLLGVLAGGWYAYENYLAAPAANTASPTPLPSVSPTETPMATPTPTPEPSPSAEPSATVDTNSNTGMTSQPNATETPGPAAKDTRPQTAPPKDTAPKAPKQTTPKQPTKPKSSDDRTIILQ